MWEEARDTLGVHAYHAAVMLCRKILFHIAVEKGLGEAGKDGFAPNFTACINHLRQTQVITGPMQAWVNRIKDVGGEANHQIRTITAEEADDVATFTETLLAVAYEMEARRRSSAPRPEADTEEEHDPSASA